jgi:hypothetical protein
VACITATSVRLRSHRILALSLPGVRYHPVDGRTSLQVKEVQVGDQRYIVCRNLDEAKKDAAARAAILAKLEHTLAHAGPKAVIGNIGFKRFVTVAKGSVAIDRAAVERDARLDGKFVLRTTTALSAEEVARAYKSLWRVERAFRETKSTFEVRPIFHHRDDTSTGHIVACFLALRLEVDLQRRLDERQVDVSWPDLMRDLTEVRAVDLALDGQRYRLRTDLRGSAYHAFAAAGVRPRPSSRHSGRRRRPRRASPRSRSRRSGKVRPLSRNYPESRESQKQTVENESDPASVSIRERGAEA